MSPSPKTFDFGVLLFPDYQWLDAAGSVDYINSHSHRILKSLNEAGLAGPDPNKAPIINWHYLSCAGDLEPILATSGPKQYPTTTFATCPPINYLLVPGPTPTLPLSNECKDFLVARFPTLEGLLTICSGSLVLAQTGLLDGHHAASNKVALKVMAEFGLLNRNVKWVGDRRFVLDGKIWSAAGVTAGIDLAAEFSRVHFDPEIVEYVKDISEYISNPATPDPFARILDGVKLN